jgi:hypothetical protein
MVHVSKQVHIKVRSQSTNFPLNLNRIGGVMVSVFTLSVVYHGFQP